MYNVEEYSDLHNEVFGYSPEPYELKNWVSYSPYVQQLEWDALQDILTEVKNINRFQQQIARITAIGVCEGVAIKCIVELWFKESGIVKPTYINVNDYERIHNLPYGYIKVDLIFN